MLCPYIMQPAFSSLLPFLDPVHVLWPFSQSVLAQIEEDQIAGLGDVQKNMQLLDEVHQLLLEEMQFATRTQGRSSADALPSSRTQERPSADALSSSSQTEKTDKAFTVFVIMRDFSPDELSVKVVGRKLLVTGTKTTRTEDEKGAYSYKHEIFRREWDVPEDLNPEELVCSVYSDGQLLIGRPYLALPTGTERTVPIQLSPDISPAAVVSSRDERTVPIQLNPEFSPSTVVPSSDERTVPIQLSLEITPAAVPSGDRRTVTVQLNPEFSPSTVVPSSDERTVPIQVSSEITPPAVPSGDRQTVTVQLSPEITPTAAAPQSNEDEKYGKKDRA
ncbi:heat shock protein beta-11-like [Microcaecilia unicolor]|uniref:Heat shock protein beta-11-like n=1 Tax=Microcaecilia unicolor TaxID=1415580 RepID=A0A6P7YXB8_9AMPH|nr:heat shock protein beta-11-like [Microcaecilia unicolor]